MTHTLHPRHTGRDVCDAVLANNATSGQKKCSICDRAIKQNKPAFRCLPCDFALCEECDKGSRHPAHIAHPLYLIDWADRPRERWRCGACTKTDEQIGETSCYHCQECKFSLCRTCFKAIKLPLHAHLLNRTDVRYTYHASNGEWRCDSCGGCNGPQNYFPRHCSRCNFDLCDSCCQAWRSPLHDHPLFKADSTLVYPEYSGGWRCDNCSRRFNPDINKNPYHCSDCSFDLCGSCIRTGPSYQGRTDVSRILPRQRTTVFRSASNHRSISKTTAGNPVTTPVEDVEDSNPAAAEDTSSPCVVCMSKPRDATIVHGDTGHICCCFKCGQELRRRGATCPICRAPIDIVIKQFIS